MRENEQLLLVKKMLATENVEKANEIFQEIVPENNVMYFLVKGLLEQKFQQWGTAINSFQKVLELDPGNIEAKNHIQIIQSILNFWNPETFNP